MKLLLLFQKYITYFFQTRRGVFLLVLMGTLNILMTFFLIGLNFYSRKIAGESTAYFQMSEIDLIRQRLQGSGFLKILWLVAVVFEASYLYKNSLFNRFLLNGFSRVNWLNFLLLNVIVVSLIISILQLLFINGLGVYLYNVYFLKGISYGIRLWVALIYTGIFGILLSTLISNYLTPFLAIGWLIFESISNNRILSEIFLGYPKYLPMWTLDTWMDANNINWRFSVVLVLYFLMFMTFSYYKINKKVYV